MRGFVTIFSEGTPATILAMAFSMSLVGNALADPWADASPAVEYGPGAGFGQGFYPGNILGPPDPGATPSQPAYAQDELLTLGKDGWVVLQFTNNTVVDGDGPDFTVFENVMQSGPYYFRETAFVDVSQDGVTWIRFPWDPATLTGLAGVWPTTGDDPTDPDVSGGDHFDLSDVNMPWISFVRLTDCGDSVEDGGLFDLDAAVAVNSMETGMEGVAPEPLAFTCNNPAENVLEVRSSHAGTLMIFGLDGRLEYECPVSPGANHLSVGSGRMITGVRLVVFRKNDSGKTISMSVVFLR